MSKFKLDPWQWSDESSDGVAYQNRQAYERIPGIVHAAVAEADQLRELNLSELGRQREWARRSTKHREELNKLHRALTATEREIEDVGRDRYRRLRTMAGERAPETRSVFRDMDDLERLQTARRAHESGDLEVVASILDTPNTLRVLPDGMHDAYLDEILPGHAARRAMLSEQRDALRAGLTIAEKIMGYTPDQLAALA